MSGGSARVAPARRPDRWARIGLAAVAALALAACDDGAYTVEVSFDPALSADSAASIDLVLVRSCPSDAEVQSGVLPSEGVVQELTLDRSQESLPTFAAVPPGTYGLYARAVGATCTVIGAACVPVTLDEDGESTLGVTIAASAPLGACAAADVCTDGVCVPTGDKVATRVSAGRAHSCALFTTNEIWCWGDNTHGQLGQGDTSPRAEPVQVMGDRAWQKLSAGWDHTCAIDVENRLFCWGRADDGRLGHDQGASHVPAQVGTLNDWQVISASARTTCGRVGEDAFCWGANEAGQLGVNDTNPRATPSLVDIDDFEEYPIAAGGTDTTGHMAIVRHETVSLIIIPLGRRFDLYTSGAGAAGGGRASPGKVLENLDPSVQLTAGGEHTCILGFDRVFCGGANTHRQLGRDDTTTPEQVGDEDDWTQISAGARHTCGRRGTTAWCWGDNGAGQSVGGESITPTPAQVGTSDGWTWISAGVDHSCGVREGLVYCWGSNENNRSGLGDGVAGQTSPVDFVDFADG